MIKDAEKDATDNKLEDKSETFLNRAEAIHARMKQIIEKHAMYFEIEQYHIVCQVVAKNKSLMCYYQMKVTTYKVLF